MGDGYLFYTLSYNPTLVFNFVAQIVPTAAIRALSVGSCVPLMYPHHCGICFCFCFLNIFLLSVITKCSRLIFYTSCPIPKITKSQGVLVPYIGE